MNVFRQLDTTYQHLTTRPRPAWLAAITSGGYDDVVAAIRDDRPNTATSDSTLRALLAIARHQPDALTVAMHALAPRLRARLARSVTDDYRADALTDLTIVLLDSPLDGPALGAPAREPSPQPRPQSRPIRRTPAASSTSPPSPRTTPSSCPDTTTPATKTSPPSLPAVSTSSASTPPSRPPSTTAN